MTNILKNNVVLFSNYKGKKSKFCQKNSGNKTVMQKIKIAIKT